MTNLLNLNAAGIDVASKEHFVAVPSDRDDKPVQSFGSFTKDLHRLAKWLKSCEIETVVMESTGVYWYHLYSVLSDYGFEVMLVNAYQVKNVPGRKSDVSDAQWLQQLHTFGLLNGCFQPDNLTRELREYVRTRKQLIKSLSRQTQRMQKAFELMNIKLNNVIRDINGKTGRKIIKKILAGERCPEVLARLKEPGVKASHQTIKDSLEGNWREEQLFNLRIAYDQLLFLEQKIKQCDIACEKTIKKMASSKTTPKEIKPKRKQKNQPKYNIEQYLYDALGVDITNIYGIKSTTALTVVSETGTDLKNKFPTEKQFLSWLNLVPNNKISGGKVLSSKVKKKKNKAGQAFREAAATLWRAKNPLGDYIRKKKIKSGSSQAVIATARKIASIYYQMVTKGEEFDDSKLIQKSKENLIKKAYFYEKKLNELKVLLPDIQGFSQSVI